MKKYKDFVPRPDAEFLIWLAGIENDLERLVQTTLLTMSSDRTSKCLAGIRQLRGLLQEIDSVKHTLSGLVELKNLQRKLVVRMIRDITT